MLEVVSELGSILSRHGVPEIEFKLPVNIDLNRSHYVEFDLNEYTRAEVSDQFFRFRLT